MPSVIRLDEIAEMVEWLRPVAAVSSVREARPRRRIAAMTIARLRLRRSSWRMPTVMLLSLARTVGSVTPEEANRNFSLGPSVLREPY
jgi:hypothetical protein